MHFSLGHLENASTTEKKHPQQQQQRECFNSMWERNATQSMKNDDFVIRKSGASIWIIISL